jgi:hypothetical protein
MKSRMIKGWRQVPRSKPGLPASRFLPLPRAPSPPAQAPGDAAAKERWESEGGQLGVAAPAAPPAAEALTYRRFHPWRATRTLAS